MSRKFAYALAASTLAIAAVPAHASSFNLHDQSAKGEGRAFAGGAAAADDPSTVYFNPAGMTELGKAAISVNSQFIFVHSSQQNENTTLQYPGVPVAVPVQGDNGGQPFAQPVVVPTGFAVGRVGDSPVWLGLGITVPFGFKATYDSNFFGRYDSLNSDLKAIDVQPSIAVKLNDHFSIGGGIDIQQINVTLDSALPNLVPGAPDGLAHVKGNDLSVGWNLGATATFGAVRLGAHYRSGIKHHLGGAYDISGLLGPLAGANGSYYATAPLDLPGIATVSAMYGVGKPFRLMLTGKYYNWSTFKDIAINPIGAAPTVSPQNYRDTFSVAAGAEYDLSNKLTLRTGTMYDETPTVDAYRTTRVPDGNRIWASAGMTYNLSKKFSFNLSYAHIFVGKEPLDRTDVLYQGTPAQTISTVRSTNTGNADIIATSLTWHI
ncbi:outer membrane protein transport protein [Stakelama sediminis]|uniref:Long-chain fatty acid transport protein n=1 Tax=Stakelama sediminis TaxID=463200 RepID=A0A840YZF2_9SPHN|nr:outer membrane protein transport protein [Stakelama sediminis]MBB5718985.1 long-chain fatty acid transport protein [Stakelama sediminis]